MKFEESDLDFSLLDPTQFEELCFDLLRRLGFHELKWRKGGADSGRDIEGKYFINLPLVEMSEEAWAIECKHHTGGVPVEALASKLSWAEAERPDRLVLIVSSHLTNSARNWLEKRRPQMPCRIHLVEGKSLKHLLLAYDKIVELYFGDRYSKLLKQSFETWSLHGLIPSLDTLLHLVKHLPLEKLEGGELAFLWCLCLFKSSEIEKREERREKIFEERREEIFEERWRKIFPVSALVDALRPFSSGGSSVLEPYQTLSLYHSKLMRWNSEVDGDRTLTCGLLIQYGGNPRLALYGFDVFSNGQGLESLVWGGSRPEAKIRYLSKGGVAAFEAAENLLDERDKANRAQRNQRANKQLTRRIKSD